MKITVYENNMKDVKKVLEAEDAKIPFGLARRVVGLFNEEKLNDTGYVMETVTKSWDDLVQLLGRIFPDATEEDWDTVDLAEMVQVVKDFLLLKLKKLIGIPVDEKN
ncbi:hypothetical protein DXB01_04610 [Clostridium sp. OF10-22XD]|nr:hypothetical protein DXB01_04610 [Clostridium sp. OF10-22XD]DAG66597.1 MAG TPA: hypothetical protein [Caudoviricetes sp.]